MLTQEIIGSANTCKSNYYSVNHSVNTTKSVVLGYTPPYIKGGNVINNITEGGETGTKLKALNVAEQNFLTYMRTMQFLKLSRKGEEQTLPPVHIPQKEIETHFFVYPEYNRKESLQKLMNLNEIRITEGKSANGRRFKEYAALQPGDCDFSLVKLKQDNFTCPIIHKLREYLKGVSLPAGAPSTLYFTGFLKNKDQYLNLFFTVDEFSRRIHTPVTNFHREYRKNILFYGCKTASLDVTTMQPLLLGKILKNEIGKNEYSDWIDSGEDIYIKLKNKANLETRDQGKKRFFEMLFSPPSQELLGVFGAGSWISWINSYKRLVLPRNPHNKYKRYSNLAWLLQSTEVKIMYKVWKALDAENIEFLTVHDEIIIKRQDKHEAESIFHNALKNEFKYFNLNSKI